MLLPPSYLISLSGSKRTSVELEHLASRGVFPQIYYGFDGAKLGLETKFPYEVDNPGSGYKIDGKHIGLCLSHFGLWRGLLASLGQAFTVLEDDAEFPEVWEADFDSAFESLPADWDLFYFGSCCCSGRVLSQVYGNLFKVAYPLCTHAYCVRKRALKELIETQERIFAPIDLSMMLQTLNLHRLNVYAYLPRLVSQRDTVLVP